MGARGGGLYIWQVELPRGQGCCQLQTVGAGAGAGRERPPPPPPEATTPPTSATTWQEPKCPVEDRFWFSHRSSQESQVSRVGPGPTHRPRAFTGSADSRSRWRDKGQAYFCLGPCSPGLKAFLPPAATCFEHPGGVKDRKRWLRSRPLLFPKTGGSGVPEGRQSRAPRYREEGVPPAQLTSIRQVMIPGSSPTALKAPLRDMVLVFARLPRHRVSRGDEAPHGGQAPTQLFS